MAKKDSSPRLGRGLAALLGDEAVQLAQASRTGGHAADHGAIAVDLLHPAPFQPRRDMDPEKLAELADSIRSRGVLQPLLVRPDPADPGRYQIIAGERRWRAAQLAGLYQVPVHIRALDDSEAMAAALVENLQRADLNPVEEAEGLRRLTAEYALTQEELAGAVGKSRPHVANMLRLLNLPAEVLDHLRQGALSIGHARALLAHPDPAAAARLVIARNLTVRQTEALAAGAKGDKPVRTVEHDMTGNDPEITRLEGDLSARLGLKVRIAFDGRKGGFLRIDYRSLEQFEGLMRLLDPR